MQFHSSAPSPRRGDDAPLLLSKSDSGVTTSKIGAARGFRVLIADRDSMSGDLLATALTRDRDCHASAVPASELLRRLEAGQADLVVIGAELNQKPGGGFDLARTIGQDHPGVLIVLLLNQASHQSVVNAFRSGARGVFSRQEPVVDLMDCIEHVRKGLIWAGRQETSLLLDAIKCIPSPDIAMASESVPLTEREMDVVRCAATGKTNKVIAAELALSEHTVKNYLFKAFEKLGVSNRIELLFYLTLRGHKFGPGKPGDSETKLKVS